MSVIIGVDPHKATHTAVAIRDTEEELDRITVRATVKQVERSASGLPHSASAPGRSSRRPGSATCWPSSSSTRASTLSMCRRCWPRGSARSTRGGPTRTTPTTRARSPSRHCARRGCGPCSERITPSCCACCPSATTTWGGRACGSSAASMRRSPTCSRAGSPRKCTHLTPIGSSDAYEPVSAVEHARKELALELVDDVRRVDEQLKASRRRIKLAVQASGTTLTELYGVGPVLACGILWAHR